MIFLQDCCFPLTGHKLETVTSQSHQISHLGAFKFNSHSHAHKGSTATHTPSAGTCIPGCSLQLPSGEGVYPLLLEAPPLDLRIKQPPTGSS